MDSVAIIIPVRGGSRRLPRKNMLRIGGETLIARKVRQVSPLGRVWVGSDDDEMLEEARRCGAEAVRRTCTDEGRDSANDMIAEMMRLIAPCDTVVWAHCTNPLLETRTYEDALASYRRGLGDGYDSLVSVREARGHFWRGSGMPLYDLAACMERHVCAGDLPPLYEQDGGIFVQPYAQMRRNSYFFGERPLLYPVPEEECFDINTPRDWKMLQGLLSGGK